MLHEPHQPKLIGITSRALRVSKYVASINAHYNQASQHRPTHNHRNEHSLRKRYKPPAFHFLMPSLGEVRRFAELFVRMGLVKGEGGDYVPACAECVEYLDGLLSGGRDGIVGFIVFMCLVRELLNDASIDTNMDINYAEMTLKHVLDKHQGAAEAVNTLYEEIADRINAEGPNRARKVCEAVINGDLII